MRIKKHLRVLMVLTPLVVCAAAFAFFTRSHTVDFSTEVKPIINKHCISCHGGVKAKGGFSLLFREEALAKTKSGKYAIVPGKPGQSEMIRRLTLKDPEERMPYQHDPLSKEEIDILHSWVKQGAKWGDHWAYLPVAAPAVPQPSAALFGLFGKEDKSWPDGSLDRFIFQKMDKAGLSFSPQAPKPALLRRVALDITGLPPSESLAAKFLKADGNAYTQLVDSLLASPHFGERWAAVWMDIARYADTKGYERDDSRNIWPYRDWLIKSFNEDKPYNRFLVEQMAGDLLPNATDEQWLATAFHRNTMTNDEGGTDNEEFRTAAVMDRVNTTWEGLMGTTFACVQCHSHPYDPFRHEEYYQFMAFFNNTRDEDTWADYPHLRLLDSADQLQYDGLNAWLLNHGFKKEAAEIKSFIRNWQPARYSITTDKFENCELVDTKWLAMRNPSTARMSQVLLEDRPRLVFRFQGYVPNGVWELHLDSVKGPLLYAFKVPITKGFTITEIDLPQVKGTHDVYFTYRNPSLQSPDVNGIMFDWFHFTHSFPGKSLPGYATQKAAYWDLVTKTKDSYPVMVEAPDWMQRATHVFDRGNWLVKGKKVQAAVPASLNKWPKGAPRNRMGLALWMTDTKNPLTARTMVNRVWEQLFGAGLVETLEDLGTQGAEPSHRELLDHLAYRFMHDWNWSTKKLIREIVLSQTYRQDTKVQADMLRIDPENKLYARSSRVRLPAEALRDQALAASGLLSRKMYGPSVMPWQPGGIWLSPWNGAEWKRSEGEDQYRRALYTYWKRTAPYPSMITYDGVGREVCTSRRIRTNTPLQALTTLNDSVYLEAAKHLALQMQQRGNTIAQQIGAGYRQLLYTDINQQKLKVLQGLYQQALSQFKTDRDAALSLAEALPASNKGKGREPELAALIVVANALLNLDEVVTKS